MQSIDKSRLPGLFAGLRGVFSTQRAFLIDLDRQDIATCGHGNREGRAFNHGHANGDRLHAWRQGIV
jgi:hypothetical protein